MKLTEIFNKHKLNLISDIADEVDKRGGAIKLSIIIGGRDSIGLDRRTCLDRVYLQRSLFDENPELCIMAHDCKHPSERIERPMHEFSLDVIETICMAVDIHYDGKEVNNGR